MFGYTLLAQKKTFQSFSRSDYQCPQCKIMFQVRNLPLELLTNSFSLKLSQGIYVFEAAKENQTKMFLEKCIVQHAQTTSVLAFQPTDF